MAKTCVLEQPYAVITPLPLGSFRVKLSHIVTFSSFKTLKLGFTKSKSSNHYTYVFVITYLICCFTRYLLI